LEESASGNGMPTEMQSSKKTEPGLAISRGDQETDRSILGRALPPPAWQTAGTKQTPYRSCVAHQTLLLRSINSIQKGENYHSSPPPPAILASRRLAHLGWGDGQHRAAGHG